MLSIGSLFSGIGGFELGLEWAGMGPVKWQVEIDGYCQKVLARHWPDAKRYGDIHDVGKYTLEPVDLICGGFPCQPYSVAGKRRGAADDRALWPEMRRVIAELMPRWVIGENVSGFVRMGLDAAVSDLENLGYSVRTHCIPAVAVGAWHQRKRVWIIGYSEHNGFARSKNASGTEPRNGTPSGESKPEQIEGSGCGRSGNAPVADSHREREPQPSGIVENIGQWTGNGGKDVSDAERDGLEGREPTPGETPGMRRRFSEPDSAWRNKPANRAEWWKAEPGVGVGSHGVSTRLDGGIKNGTPEENRPSEALSDLQQGSDKEEIRVRAAGRFPGIHSPEVLQPNMHGECLCQRCAIKRGIVETGREIPWEDLRIMWGYQAVALPSHRRESEERLKREYPDLMHSLSWYPPPPCEACWDDGSWQDGIPSVSTEKKPRRVERLKALGNAVVPQVVMEIGKLILAYERARDERASHTE